ncbi:MAG: hypothetical protein AAB815_02125 [Patescibacteria group bacterium]
MTPPRSGGRDHTPVIDAGFAHPRQELFFSAFVIPDEQRSRVHATGLNQEAGVAQARHHALIMAIHGEHCLAPGSTLRRHRVAGDDREHLHHGIPHPDVFHDHRNANVKHKNPRWLRAQGALVMEL